MKNKKYFKDHPFFSLPPEIAIIPSCDRFYNPRCEGEIYEWQSWGLVIRHLRCHAGMDQSVFGRLLRGYTRTQISRYEVESAEPPIDFWIKISKTFGLNITWALTGKGLPFIDDFKDSEEMKRFMKWVALLTEKTEFLKELTDD